MASELTGISGNISVPYDGELTHGLVLLGVCMDQGHQRMFFHGIVSCRAVMLAGL